MSLSSWIRKCLGLSGNHSTIRRTSPKRNSSPRFFRLEAEGLEERITPFSYRYYAQGGWTADTIAAAIKAELNPNQAPIISNQSFSLNENVSIGTSVGTVLASDPNAGQTLTYAITGGNVGNAFAINPTTGAITTASGIDFETLGTYTLTVRVTDNGSTPLSKTASVTINVNNVNEAPSVQTATLTVNENATNGAVVGTVSSTDPDAGSTLTYSIASGNTGNVFAINPSTGQITVASSIDFETLATYSLIVQATDNGNPALNGTATITINVNNVNETPSVTPATFSVNENVNTGTVVGTAAASDPDASTTLTYSIVAGNVGNAFAINAQTGQITVVGQLDFETVASYGLTVQVADNGNPALVGQATITININDVNDAPTVAPATFTVAENASNGAVVGTVAATNVDSNQTLTYSITGGNTGNVFAIDPATGQITLTGALNFETTATYSLTVQATDNGTPVLSGQATITINVTNVNEAPSVTPATFTVAENTSAGTVVGTVAASDPDANSTLTYAITAGNTGNVFAIDPATGQITVVGTLDFETTPSYSLTVLVTDNGSPGLSAQGAATITITNVNEAPTVTPATFSIAENSANATVVGAVAASDPDANSTLTYSIVSGNAGNVFAIDPATGQITVVGSLDFETVNQYALVVQATDNGTPALSGQATVTINITNANDAPTVAPATFSIAENSANGAPVGAVAATDPEGSTNLTYAITGGNVGNAFAMNANTGQITVNGSLDFETLASYSLTVSVTDDGNPTASGQATITINLTNVNETPTVTPATLSIAESATAGTVVGTAAASDPDAATTLTYAITAGNTGNAFAIDPATGQITVSGPLDFETLATYALTVQVTDNGVPALSSQATITINIGDVNEATPVVTAATFAVNENAANGTVAGTVAASDADTAQSLTYAITAGNTGNVFAINPTTGAITVVGSLDFETLASYTLTVKATDNGNPALAGQGTITININDQNEAPTVSPATFAIDEDATTGTSVGSVTASDPDAGSTLAYSITAGNTGNAFAINSATGEITVAGALDFETLSTYTLTVEATDNGNPVLSSQAIVTIHLNDINEADPVVTAATFSVNENSANGTVVGTVAASDADTAQSLTYSITGGNTGNAFAINPTTGQITVSGSLNFESLASYSLTIQATDNGNPTRSGTNTVTINLNNVNEAPTVSPATFSVDENSANGTIVGSVSASDVDAGQTLSYAITAGNTGNAFAIDASGQITVNGPLDFETLATYTLTVEVTDNGNPALSGQATITVNLNNLNEAAPVVTAANFSVNENSANGVLVGSVVANDADAAQSLTYSIVAGNTGNAFAIDPPTGAITVAGSLDFETLATYTLTVQATDNGNPVLSGQNTVTITVNDVNETPTVSPATFAIDENSANGAAVGTVAANDVDAGQTLTYSIVAGNTGGAFAINAATGAITVNGSLDFETLASYSLTVQATDDGNPALSGTATVTINVNNVNEAPIVAAATFAVNENSTAATVVGTVAANDVDAGSTLSYAIVSGNTGNAFAINASTGEITVAGTLNFETLASYTLTVEVTDNGIPALTGQASVTINLTDVNEAPSASNATFAINEDAAIGNAVGTVSASDVDAGSTLTYAIVGGNTGNAFAINASTGAITVNGPLNFETLASYSLTVEVTDNGNPGLTGQATITINLNDVNDAPTISTATFSIAENSANGTVVGSVSASDVDAGQTLSYAIVGGNTGNAFAIDSNGQITVVGSLDFETLSAYSLTVQVTDNGNPVLSNQATITINLTDVNEAPPVVAAATFAINENSAAGTVVGSASATDADTAQSVTYAIVGGNTGNAFAINSTTGQITVNGSLNFESLASYSLVVEATDNGNPTQSGQNTVTININNVNDAPTASNQSFNVANAAVNGTVVGSVSASDQDAGQSLAYAITAGNDAGAFALDPLTGQITVVGTIDVNAQPSYSLTVEIIDNGAPTLSTSITLSITVV